MNDILENEIEIDLAKTIRSIARKYLIALRKTSSKGSTLKDSGEEDDYQRYINKVKRAYEKLDDLEKHFINNDFFYQEYPYWWKVTFSKSSYYRIRRKSMTAFLEAFNNEY